MQNEKDLSICAEKLPWERDLRLLASDCSAGTDRIRRSVEVSLVKIRSFRAVTRKNLIFLISFVFILESKWKTSGKERFFL